MLDKSRTENLVKIFYLSQIDIGFFAKKANECMKFASFMQKI
jgi:hypothetical protein